MVLIRVLLLFLFIGFFSCSVQKKASKLKRDKELFSAMETITTRRGDTVTYVVPNVKFKDTTITRANYQTGTTQLVRYSHKGDIDLIQCLSGDIKEIIRHNQLLIESIKEKQQDKTETLNSSLILYLFLGLGVIILVVGLLSWKIIKSQSVIHTLLK